MRKRDTKQILLEDILYDNDYTVFRETLLVLCHKNLALKKIRSRSKVIAKPCLVLASSIVLIVSGIFLWRSILQTWPKKHQPYFVEKPQSLEKKQALDLSRPPQITIVSTNTTLHIVPTQKPQQLQIISDHELLSLFVSHPTLLIQNEAKEAKFVFLNPKDENIFMKKIPTGTNH